MTRFWPPLLALSAATFATVTAEMLPAGVIRQLGSGLAVGDSAAGLLVTAWALTIAVTSIPLVRATLRWRRKRLVLACLAVVSLANLATGLAPVYAAALVTRIVAAAAHGVFWAVVVAYAAALVDPERVGRAVSVVLAGPALAGLVGLPAGSAVANALGWRVAFVVTAAVCVASAALIAVVLPDVTTGTDTGAGAGAGARRGGWDRTARPVLVTALGGALALVGYYATFTFIVPLSVLAGFSSGSVPGLLAAAGAGGLVGVVVAGRAADRWPGGALIVTTAALAAAIAGLAIHDEPALFVVDAVLWGALIGVLPVVLQARVLRLSSDAFRPIAGSVLVTALNLGIGLGAALGSLTTRLGLSTWLPSIAGSVTIAALVPLVIASGLARRVGVRPPHSAEAVCASEP